jgi:uncharacterized protein YcbK (DUF882 family)
MTWLDRYFPISSLLAPPLPPPAEGEVRYQGHSVSDPETREKLGELAKLLDLPVVVTSGDRTPEDQERLLREGYQPAKDSEHLHGRAADIYVPGMTAKELAPFAKKAGFTGIGIYDDGHLHVDTRPLAIAWGK